MGSSWEAACDATTPSPTAASATLARGNTVGMANARPSTSFLNMSPILLFRDAGWRLHVPETGKGAPGKPDVFRVSAVPRRRIQNQGRPMVRRKSQTDLSNERMFQNG